VIACEQASSGFGWLRSTPVRSLLALRVVEVLAMAMVPTVATRHELISAGFKLTDAVAVAAMLGFGAALGALVWKAAPREPLAASRQEHPRASPARGSRWGRRSRLDPVVRELLRRCEPNMRVVRGQAEADLDLFPEARQRRLAGQVVLD
jgi:hypothetical protein